MAKKPVTKAAETSEEEAEEAYTHLVYKTGAITITGNNNTVNIVQSGEPPDPDPPEDDDK